MRFGHFDDQAREYVITTPETPWPWINYLGNESFFSLISNTMGGYSFYKDARLRRITRYRYNSAPVDMGGKYFYINDGGDIWNPGWMPVKAGLDGYECRHGMGYTRITGSRNGLQAEVLSFVPIGCSGEVMKLRITNTGTKKKSARLFTFVEWCFWDAMDDMSNFQRNLNIGEVEIEGNTIYHKTEYRERRNHYSFFHSSEEICGFDTDRESFLGPYNGFEHPKSVIEGIAGNSRANGWSPVASHCIDLEINPGEEKEMIFMLGYVEVDKAEKWDSKGLINKEPALQMIGKFESVEQVTKSMEDLKDYWNKILSNFNLTHPDDKLSRMVNIWNQYQCMVTFNLSRSASYFESGIGRGMGFRDSNQDLLGYIHMEPHRARQRILDIASTQFEDGGAYHQYQPLTKRGNEMMGGNFNDDPLWLIASTVAYIKETGDFSILEETVPFDHDPAKAKSHFDHLKASFYHVVHNKGEHDLPLIGRADWNDCLNLNCFSEEPGESFQTTGNIDGGRAESVFIGGMFVLYGNEYIQLCRQIGKNGEANDAQIHVDRMKEALSVSGWDGGWFLRAYDHFGDKVGSHECEEGKIFIEPQGMCIMAGVGIEDGKASAALDSVKEHLDCEFGLVLQQPAFTEYQPRYGEITSYPPGYKENAGIFCHNNPWIMIAETCMGHGDRAYEYYTKISPAFLEDISELHRTEPYIYAQMIAGKDADRPGEAKNSWLTGTAAWNFKAISQHILGIFPEYEGLRIDPCIPPAWREYTVERKFRGKNYKIHISNPHAVSGGVESIEIDGERIKGNTIPVRSGKSNFTVRVNLGRVKMVQ